MADFFFLIRVRAPDRAHAEMVINERLYFEEELTFDGESEPFDYEIDLAPPVPTDG